MGNSSSGINTQTTLIKFGYLGLLSEIVIQISGWGLDNSSSGIKHWVLCPPLGESEDSKPRDVEKLTLRNIRYIGFVTSHRA